MATLSLVWLAKIILEAKSILYTVWGQRYSQNTPIKFMKSIHLLSWEHRAVILYNPYFTLVTHTLIIYSGDNVKHFSVLFTVSNFLLKKIRHIQKTNLKRETKHMKSLTGYVIMINQKCNRKINAM